MVRLSNYCNLDTGDRVNNQSWAYSKLIALYTLFALRNTDGARKWAKISYSDFVLGNNPSFYSYPDQSVSGLLERRRIWRSAMLDGKKLVRQLNGPGLQ